MGKAKIHSFFEKNKGDLFINSPHKLFKQPNAQGVILPRIAFLTGITKADEYRWRKLVLYHCQKKRSQVIHLQGWGKLPSCLKSHAKKTVYYWNSKEFISLSIVIHMVSVTWVSDLYVIHQWTLKSSGDKLNSLPSNLHHSFCREFSLSIKC